LEAHIKLTVVAIVEVGIRGLEKIVGVHLILDVVVALVFLFFFLVDFGFDIDEHVALGLLSAFRGPRLQEVSVYLDLFEPSLAYHDVVLVLLIVVIVVLVVIFVLLCAFFFIILVIVVASLGYIIVLIILVCGSWPAHRCAGGWYVIFVNFGHRVEWLIVGARVAVVVARHGAVDARVRVRVGAARASARKLALALAAP
jgi:hypothetical protein